MNKHEKIKFYPLKVNDVAFTKTLLEIIQEFRVQTYYNKEKFNYTFNEFVNSILAFMRFHYGECIEPITVGQMSRLYAVYETMRGIELDSKLDN